MLCGVSELGSCGNRSKGVTTEPPNVLPSGRLRMRAAVALEAVDLADLERVVAGAAVQRRDGGVVVDREVVVAALAEHHQPTVDRAVVIDALHRLRAHRRRRRSRPRPVPARGRIRPSSGSKSSTATNAESSAYSPGRLPVSLAMPVVRRSRKMSSNGLAGAVECRVVVVRAVDREVVDAVVGRARVEHVDDVVAHVAVRAGRVDDVGVGARLAVERQRVARGCRRRSSAGITSTAAG